MHHDGAWYTAKPVSAGERLRHRLVVPNAPGLRQFILTELHDSPEGDSPSGGHFGVTKTQQALDHCFWWPTCRADVRLCIASCASC